MQIEQGNCRAKEMCCRMCPAIAAYRLTANCKTGKITDVCIIPL